MGRNYSIKCDVVSCKNNAEGVNCTLDCVKITCDETHCSRCKNYVCK